MLIEGVIGPGFMSDIGLDDTVFTPECDLYPHAELPTTTIVSTTTPSPCPVAGQVHCAGTTVCIDADRVMIFLKDSCLR